MKKKNNSEEKKERKSKKDSEEESELEKEIEEESEFEEETISRFPSERIKAPVLEKINMSEVPFSLERGIISTGSSVEKNENKNEEFNYITKANGEEPKYQNYENQIFTDLRHQEIESLGRVREDLFPRKNVGFAISPEARPVETNFEKYEAVSRVEKENLGRGDLFPKKEIKYRPSSH